MTDKPRGRPPFPEGTARTIPTCIRMTPAERQKFDWLGGIEWFRAELKRARLVFRPKGKA